MEDAAEVGYIKYCGEAVGHGVLDAGKAGLALTGLNEAIRYFNSQQAPGLAKAEYEVPVRVRDGSWEAIVIAGLSAFAMAYLGRAGNEAAKKDWEGVGLKDVFSKSIKAIVHLIRLAKHTSSIRGWMNKTPLWRKENEEIGIPNSKGEYEYFPAEFVKWYATMPPHLMKKMADVVEEGRALTVGAVNDAEDIKAEITVREKAIFTGESNDEDSDEILFPELQHGDVVELEGRLTRGNAETNSLGLEYEGHILNCVPETGSVVKYKPALFLKCRIHGRVSRLLKAATIADRRPTIVISKVVPLERDKQRRLF